MHKKQINLYPNYLTYPAIILFGLFFALPVVAAILLSFTDWNINRLFSPHLNGIQNFSYIFDDEYFLLSVKNTIFYAVLTCFIKLVLSLGLAVVLNRKLRTRNFLRTIFYMPAAIGYVVVGLIFTSIFRMDGMLNQLLHSMGLGSLAMDWLGNGNTALLTAVVVDIWKWTGFGMIIFIAGLQTISSDYYESARIDGASSFKQFMKITLPLLAPAMSVNVTMNIIGGLKVFDSVFVLTNGGPGYASSVLNTYIYQAFGEGLLGRSTAMGMMLFVAVFIVSFASDKLLRKGEGDL